jgi:5-methylcytosine-specific restriction endonuclease McrA
MLNTLVLNATHEVMKIVSWQKAITWLFLDKIDIIEEYDEHIHTSSAKFRVPAVVMYKKAIKPKYRILKFSRTNVYARDNFSCQYCSNNLSRFVITWDHILPRSRGGESSWLNCVACCAQCNIKKANRTPKEAGMKLLREPRQPGLTESFVLALNLKTTIIPDVWNNYLSYIKSNNSE